MTKRLHFGNIGTDMTKEQLNAAVAVHGDVLSTQIITDRDTGMSRGFGFAEVEDADAQKVITALNGSDWHGQQLAVSLAHERNAIR